MKWLSATIIVTAGVALVSSSQWCTVTIMSLKPVQSAEIARHGWEIGVCLIIAGMLGWAFLLFLDWHESPTRKRSLDSKGTIDGKMMFHIDSTNPLVISYAHTTRTRRQS